MPGVDGHGPSYISAHSADVILSDIRPIKLKPEALRAINVLLDEFLSRILSASGSLVTDRLRSSLLSLLPTSLGKEALLEAEVELRAYWERTDTKSLVEDDSRTFHLQWAFSLLRLKCEAYSTLNEEDEDPASEGRINERFGMTHPHAQKALLAPAALYLTAILESICEHILSNVGRVAARDSSRTSATVNDLYVALCEDDSIYGLFKTMKVYEHIELMSIAPKSRRSKSFTRNGRFSLSHASLQHDLTLVNSSSGSRSRQSSEGQLASMHSSTSGSRTSAEKSRAIRMFANNKVSGDGETQSGHKKSASIRSDNSRPFPEEDPFNPAEDAAMAREFDDLMRSTSTMKVSLTPDRLRTMEVYKQEKGSRSKRLGSGLPLDPDIIPSNIQIPPLRHVESVINEEDQNHSQGRARQTSVTTPPNPSLFNITPTRSRSVSTSAGIRSPPVLVRKATRTSSIQVAPSSFPNAIPVVDMVQSRIPKTNDNDGFPPRTRVRQRNRDSLDLDDVMNGFDDDDQEVQILTRPRPRTAPTPNRVNPPHTVSANTRDLMDFLAQGPPEPPVSKNGKDFVDFLAAGPPDYGSDSPKSKSGSGGRLQRMISKLNLGNGEKGKGSESARVQQTKLPSTPIHPTVNPKLQGGTFSSLANRPTPPRPPRPISPPSPHSPGMSDENKSVRSMLHRPHQDSPLSREPTSVEKQAAEKPIPPVPIISLTRVPPTTDSQGTAKDSGEKILHRVTPNLINGNGNARVDRAVPIQLASIDVPPVPSRTISSPIRKPAPAVASTPTPSIPESEIRDMQKLLSNATTVDECRVILDMFMARNGMPREPKIQGVPDPSPSLSVVQPTPYTGVEASLESSLVEFFLGGSLSSQIPSDFLQSQVDGVSRRHPERRRSY